MFPKPASRGFPNPRATKVLQTISGKRIGHEKGQVIVVVVIFYLPVGHSVGNVFGVNTEAGCAGKKVGSYTIGGRNETGYFA
jgi:hypothetical protein